eukprot:CAMPEP_0195519264 /NCGR_PEP_ID=MMETSP0794_2-20130614/14545_1 /TAXON_ID=515487 /ORGANISM="Stephanopyxis turris, Strain CCMP 815" /LENGTH=404 /DNA_ID=CAMNT_0040648387 /DNA_START=141 /DNA_END=1352 /DNA_ORIENTATION=-
MAEVHPDLSTEYNQISDLFSRKLWHQLTVALLEFVSPPEVGADPAKKVTLRATPDGGNSYLALFDRVVLACDSKLNPLSLAQIASAVASSLAENASAPTVTDAEKDGLAARAVLENLLEKRSKLGPAASLFVESKLVLLGLKMMQQQGKTDKAQYQSFKETLANGAKVLEELEGESAVVPSAFYEASSGYRKIVGPPEAFYTEALMYLNYTPVESMTEEERYILATDLSLAALTGDKVFNFGEVVATPILGCLNGTPNEWLMEMMHCFTKGDVVKFHSITEASAAGIQSQPALVSRAVLVKEKITLLALVNMIFERPSNERTLGFDEIADRTKLSKNEVEMAVMRALSLGLIKGSMDQVDETLSVSWVMPRVLDQSQLKGLSERFGEWAVKVSKTRDYMGEKTE